MWESRAIPFPRIRNPAFFPIPDSLTFGEVEDANRFHPVAGLLEKLTVNKTCLGKWHQNLQPGPADESGAQIRNKTASTM